MGSDRATNERIPWGPDSDMETLAALVSQRGNLMPGVTFSRVGDRPCKQAARSQILRFLTPQEWTERLSILTMPGIGWPFERELLGSRLFHWPKEMGKAPWILIRSIEGDPAVYAAALKRMPRNPNGFRILPAKSYSTATIRTALIDRYDCCRFEDYGSDHVHDVAWLDFTGPLTAGLLQALSRFWRENVRALLFVTLMNARSPARIAARIRDAGGVAELLTATLTGGSVVHLLNYADGAPMVQIGIRKDPSAKR